MRGCHTFRQILVAHGAEDSQWRGRTGRQCDSCGQHSGFASTSVRQLLVQRCRVNGTGSHSDRGLREGRVAYYGLKKEARLEIPRQKSTISLNAAVLASAALTAMGQGSRGICGKGGSVLNQPHMHSAGLSQLLFCRFKGISLQFKVFSGGSFESFPGQIKLPRWAATPLYYLGTTRKASLRSHILHSFILENLTDAVNDYVLCAPKAWLSSILSRASLFAPAPAPPGMTISSTAQQVQPLPPEAHLHIAKSQPLGYFHLRTLKLL
ncbi:hypothetical protein P7K49_002611 [Saguinus oedipus]|uniref:Uncharacterized protein n=1 Tax=Saguinus oedipus TaxID=9490 RepID=A0ABQ9WID1_SAGOE|nr:hypothetical protein P7K49_002611 [Saguinus oedipus]